MGEPFGLQFSSASGMCSFPQKPPNLFKRHHLALPSESIHPTDTLTPSDLSVEHRWKILPLDHCISAAALPGVPHPLEQSHTCPPDDDRDQSVKKTSAGSPITNWTNSNDGGASPDALAAGASHVEFTWYFLYTFCLGTRQGNCSAAGATSF